MHKCILERITQTTPTRFWNDGCDARTLARAVEWGAQGATSNPVIVLNCIKAEPQRWVNQIVQIKKEEKTFSEIEVTWELIRRLALEALPVLKPIYSESKDGNGRLTIQVNPRYFSNPDKMIEHAMEIASWGENIAVKIPAVEAGFVAMEELVAQGLSILATVQYTVSQAIVSAEAFARGYKRAEANGLDISKMGTWAAIMVGRLDDHLRDEQKETRVPVDPEDIHYASLAVFKKVAEVYRKRGYRTKPMAAAVRGSYHCLNFVGGDVVVTLPPIWQEFINGMDEPINPQAIEQPEPPEKIDKLRRHFSDFRRAYEEDGLKAEDFAAFGATRKTLRQFIGSYEELLVFVRNCIL